MNSRLQGFKILTSFFSCISYRNCSISFFFKKKSDIADNYLSSLLLLHCTVCFQLGIFVVLHLQYSTSLLIGTFSSMAIYIGGGKLSFDKCIATPMYMPRLSKVVMLIS